jgi:hypothetical protein
MLGNAFATCAQHQSGARMCLISGKLCGAGTPTPNTYNSHVAHLFPLLDFLKHRPFGTQRKLWEV